MYPKKILLLRFSAMGDVLLLVPVLRALTAVYTDVQVTVVTRPRFASFFQNLPGVQVFEADVDYAYQGIFGTRDLFRKLIRRDDYDLVLDLHDHIRTVLLRSLFKLFGVDVIVFNKGRGEKKALIKKDNKTLTPLMHTTERYRQAFLKAGFQFDLLPPPSLVSDEPTRAHVQSWLQGQHLNKNEKWVGIAPFAMHETKIWPVSNYASLMEKIIAAKPVKFFLFGGSDKEISFFDKLVKTFPGQCVKVAGQLKIKDEIALMPYLDLMVCVDSSNMHLAALCGTPLLSIWGGTHPFAGFGPYQANEDSIVQIPLKELPCRPCSVYGKATCYLGDFPCLTRISVDMLADKIIQRL